MEILCAYFLVFAPPFLCFFHDFFYNVRHFVVLYEVINNNHVNIQPSLVYFISSLMKKCKMVVEQMDFKVHQTTKSFELFYYISYHKLVVSGFCITQKPSHNFWKFYINLLFLDIHRCFEVEVGIKHQFANSNHFFQFSLL